VAVFFIGVQSIVHPSGLSAQLFSLRGRGFAHRPIRRAKELPSKIAAPKAGRRKVGAEAELPMAGWCQGYGRSGSMESGTEVCLEGPRGIAGERHGTIGEKKRRLVVRIAAADDGGWKAIFHPIDQTAQPIPIDSVVLEGHCLKLAIGAIQALTRGPSVPTRTPSPEFGRRRGNRNRSNCSARPRNPLGWTRPLLITRSS
jgi:hypothetical protein